MPRLLYINERFGHDATIILESGDSCWISVGKKGVLVRAHKHSFWGGLLGSLLGTKLYQERPVPQIRCGDVMLKAFCTAAWHCPSPAGVKTVLNDPALRTA